MEKNDANTNSIDTGSKIASFKVKQNMPYEFKVNYARIRAWEFYNECGKRDLDCYVSVGGLDSITLFFFLKSIGINVPAVSVSSLEDISIQKIHKEIFMPNIAPQCSAYSCTRKCCNHIRYPGRKISSGYSLRRMSYRQRAEHPVFAPVGRCVASQGARWHPWTPRRRAANTDGLSENRYLNRGRF